MKKIKNMHPGIILQEELLKPLKMLPQFLAEAIDIPTSVIEDVIKGVQPITTDLSIRLSKFFGFSPNFWGNLQQDYDIRKKERKKSKKYFSLRLSKGTRN